MVRAAVAMPIANVSGRPDPGGNPGADRGHAGGIINLAGLGTSLCTPGGVGRSSQREERMHLPTQIVAPGTRISGTERDKDKTKIAIMMMTVTILIIINIIIIYNWTHVLGKKYF